MIYDSIIIGRGLIGSAAAKYISRSQKNVALIGPDEATTAAEQIVFASHYDQARIQAILGKDALTTRLNQQSANEYASLEKEANINFHSKEGCLTVFLENAAFHLEMYTKMAKEFEVDVHLFENAQALQKHYPDFNFPSSAKGIYELPPAGHINPRLLIKAQQKVFQKNGGAIFNKTIKDVAYENDVFKITSFDNQIFYAKKVLVAAGAFSNFFNLINPKVLLRLKSETTIWVKVTKEDAERLITLPALLYKINEPDAQDIYLIQPVQYPDGNFYVKMGANIPGDFYFSDLSEIQQWFRNGQSLRMASLQKALQLLLPGLSASDCFEKKCIVCYTSHGHPYIGPVDDKGLFIAAGGNGYGAMSSDALGKIAAHVVSENSFPAGFSEKDFYPVYQKDK
jgi:sarcosine oxidase